MDRTLDNRAQMTLFALLALARPATNRELYTVAGIEVAGAARARLDELGYLKTTRRGATNVHEITKAGRDWCLTALPMGRLPSAKFPSGIVHAILSGLGAYLVREDHDLTDIFKPDVETWIRAVYTELTVRRPDQYVRLAKVREWLGDEPIDDELRAMIKLPDVHLKAELDQRKISEDDRRAAVDVGDEARHLLRIGPA
jgi:hypothetical protein